MSKSLVSKQLVASRLVGLDKPSHTESLASRLAGRTPAAEINQRVDDANAVISALRASGVSSFYAAEHAKLFTKPDEAFRTRSLMKTEFEVMHSLSTRQAAKMADCVLFLAAKAPETSNIGRFKTMANVALSEGVPFTAVADAVYYSPASVTPEDFAKRCVATSLKQGKPMNASEIQLSTCLIAGLVAAGY
jgi:hypothetical protein